MQTNAHHIRNDILIMEKVMNRNTYRPTLPFEKLSYFTKDDEKE